MSDAPTWFRARGYRHFDQPVSHKTFAQDVENPAFVSQHSFLPLIHFAIETPRYDKSKNKTKLKPRDIYLSSHRDAHIFAYYSWRLSAAYEEFLVGKPFAESVLAYRARGLDNVNFALAAFEEVEVRRSCTALCFDVTGFFDNLDHQKLKQRLAAVLQQSPLSLDWYRVFRNATSFSYVEKPALEGLFGANLKNVPTFVPYCSIRGFRDKVRGAGLVMPAPTNKGVAQGLPISASFSNVYMIDFDAAMHAECANLGASYRRYSDDILIICDDADANLLMSMVRAHLLLDGLQLNDRKTDVVKFVRGRKFPRANKPMQYLGLTFDGKRVLIRSASIAKFARRIAAATNARKRQAAASIAAGKTTRLHSKALVERLTHLAPRRSFYGYVRKVGKKAQSARPRRQVSKYWDMLWRRLREPQ